VKRDDLFITSKLWNTYHKPDLVEPILKQTLANLGLDYIDLYLIHWPVGYKEGENLFPTTSEGTIAFSDVDYVDTWKAMEDASSKGLAKNIGVSNFNSEQITRLIENGKIKPVTNQVRSQEPARQRDCRLVAISKRRFAAWRGSFFVVIALIENFQVFAIPQ